MSENIIVVKIPQRATIENAGDIKTSILNAFKQNQKVHLMVSDIKTCDLSFIQIFISAQKYAIKNMQEIHLTGDIPPPLMKSLLITGLASNECKTGVDLEAEINPEIMGVTHA